MGVRNAAYLKSHRSLLFRTEHYAKWRKASGEMMKAAKDETREVVHKVLPDRRWKAEILEGRQHRSYAVQL